MSALLHVNRLHKYFLKSAHRSCLSLYKELFEACTEVSCSGRENRVEQRRTAGHHNTKYSIVKAYDNALSRADEVHVHKTHFSFLNNDGAKMLKQTMSGGLKTKFLLAPIG